MTHTRGQPTIAVEQRTGLAMLTMDDGRVNALDLEVLTDLTASLREIRTPVVITGAGKAFSAGVDLRRIVTANVRRRRYDDRLLNHEDAASAHIDGGMRDKAAGAATSPRLVPIDRRRPELDDCVRLVRDAWFWHRAVHNAPVD
jgi:hypothetical protein